MNKSWKKSTEINGHLVNYGYIDEGRDPSGRDYGSRFFVTVDDKAFPIDLAEFVVSLIKLRSTK